MGRPALLCLAWLLALVRGGYNALATVTFYVDSLFFYVPFKFGSWW